MEKKEETFLNAYLFLKFIKIDFNGNRCPKKVISKDIIHMNGKSL